MKKLVLAAFTTVALLSGCGDDGVPHVSDPHNPVDASGNPIKASEFLSKYCAGKDSNETCAKVVRAAQEDSDKPVDLGRYGGPKKTK
jgi:hypothetical protein